MKRYRIRLEKKGSDHFEYEEFDDLESYRLRLRELRCGIIERVDEPVPVDSGEYSARYCPDYWKEDSDEG